MRRITCGGCGSDRLETFLDLGKTPLADRFPTTPDEPEDWYPLEVAVCRACWLVQLLEVVPDESLWADYGFYSGASPSIVAANKTLAIDLMTTYMDLARRLTVEIGCNDGDLLWHFKAAGCITIGVDPAAGPVKAARGLGLTVMEAAFGRETARLIRGSYPAAPKQGAGLVIARNVAAHAADLHDFFGGIADLLAPDGIAVVEVQYLADLLAGNQFDHIYHEHRYYFSLASLAKIANQHGLTPRKVERTSQQGGSIRVHLAHGGRFQFMAYSEDVSGLGNMATYDSFDWRVNYLRYRMHHLLVDVQLAGQRIAGYGATAKSTTLLNYLEAGPDLLEYVEDLTPAKIGRYTPGTKIPVVAPGDREPPDVYLLLAWNYLGDVIRRERAFLEHGGRLLVPIPVPVLL